MLEEIDGVGRSASLDDKLGSDELHESSSQLVFWKTGNGSQQLIRELTSYRATDLCHPSHWCQTIKTRHQRVMQTRRDCEWRERPIEDVAITVLAQKAALQH